MNSVVVGVMYTWDWICSSSYLQVGVLLSTPYQQSFVWTFDQSSTYLPPTAAETGSCNMLINLMCRHLVCVQAALLISLKSCRQAVSVFTANGFDDSFRPESWRMRSWCKCGHQKRELLRSLSNSWTEHMGATFLCQSPTDALGSPFGESDGISNLWNSAHQTCSNFNSSDLHNLTGKTCCILINQKPLGNWARLNQEWTNTWYTSKHAGCWQTCQGQFVPALHMINVISYRYQAR